MKGILWGYVAAGAMLCVGFEIAMQAGDPWFSSILRTFGLLTACIVLKCTFAAGRVRGFAVRSTDGTIQLGNLLRNLVASAIAMFLVGFLSGPVIALLAWRHT